jgi:hypothetical protein
MIFIKNYKEWIPNNLLEYIATLTTGKIDPKPLQYVGEGNPHLDKLRSPLTDAYVGHPSITWHQWFGQSEEIASKNIILPELPKTRKHVFWWIVRLKPGQCQPTHIDPHLVEATNPVRYTMYLQDWQPGHIFVYGDNKMVVNYKAGDLYEWNDEHIYTVHGTANISYENRYTVQIAAYDDKIKLFNK